MELIADISYVNGSTRPSLASARGTNSGAFNWTIIVLMYTFIFCLSMVGNTLVFITLTTNGTVRTVTNIFLMNLAVSDLLLGVVCMPVTLIGQIYEKFMFGQLFCELIPFFQAVTTTADAWTLVVISIERYYAICQPLRSRKWQTNCHAYKVIAILWTFSLALNSPILFVSTLIPMKNNAYKCREQWDSVAMERAFNLLLDTALLLIPFVLIAVAYSLIGTKISRSLKHEKQHSKKLKNYLQQQSEWNKVTPEDSMVNSNSEQDNAKNKPKDTAKTDLQEVLEFTHVVRSTNMEKSIQAKEKVIRMLYIIVLEFFVCWTPLYIINTIYLFYPAGLYKYIGSNGVMYFQLLAYCSSCSNPITYCFMNPKFRKSCLALFNIHTELQCCDKTKNNMRRTPTPSPSPPQQNQEMTEFVSHASRSGRSSKEPNDPETEDFV